MTDPISERDARAADERRQFFDSVASDHAAPGPFKKYYSERLRKAIEFNVPRGVSVLEIGCGTGDLLAALAPSRGVGVDFSEQMVELAKARHPELTFVLADASHLALDEKFDCIVLSNVVGDLIDVQRVLQALRPLCHDRTRLIVTDFNYLWGPLVRLAEKLGLKPRQREQNWLQLADLENLLVLAGFETIKTCRDLLLPAPVPAVADIVNDWASSVPGVSHFTANALLVARPVPEGRAAEHSVSVIVACKDERGNIEELVRTVPKMGNYTELLFVDGHSKDGTVEEIERCIEAFRELNPALDDVRVYVQKGKGKGDAVRLGFEKAKGDVLMILDADITVRSEDLPKFYRALAEGKGEFINGTRLVYPMEDEAMRFLNLLGNHFFGRLFSWLLDQRLTDTLCGTKVLFRRDYERIEAGRAFFGDFDPFGDFDLLFGAAKQNLKIREVPIRYRNREYGEIKIDRFKHGVLLLKMSALAYKRFKLLRGA